MSGVLYVAAVSAELGELPGEVLGIGLVAAGVAMAERLARGRPERVVLVGTAGAFPRADAVGIGEVVVGGRLGLGSAAVALGVGYQPGAPGVLVGEGIPGVRVADVLTNLAITTDSGLAARFGAEWGVEHMETFGAAWACAQVGVPFTCVLGITNVVGPSAHAEWRANRGAAEAAARGVAARVLNGGARA